jgi:hypothetical protein
MSAGDTLYIRGGTYAEALNSFAGTNFPAGTSWSNPVTIAGYPGETVTIRPSSGDHVMDIYDGGSYTDTSYRQYIIFDNLVFDGVNQNNSVIKLDVGSRRIRIQNSKVTGNLGSNGIQWGGDTPPTTIAREHEILNVEITGNGAYGLYVGGSGNIIDGNYVHDNPGYGVHQYGDGRSDFHNNIIRNNIFQHNGFGYRLPTCAILLSSGDNNVAYNNVITNHNGCGIQIYPGQTNAKAYNNTIVGNADTCINNQPGSSGSIIRNNICYNNGNDITNDGSGAVIDHNLANTLDPLFVNAAAGDYHLQPSSPGKTASNTGGEVGAYGNGNTCIGLGCAGNGSGANNPGSNPQCQAGAGTAAPLPSLSLTQSPSTSGIPPLLPTGAGNPPQQGQPVNGGNVLQQIINLIKQVFSRLFGGFGNPPGQ